MEPAKFVFISHSNHPSDAAVCERLYAYLSAHKILCWMDREDMHVGAWDDQIIEKLCDASAFILVASRNSLVSAPVQNEIRIMVKSGKPLVPFSLDDYCLTLSKDQRSALFHLGAGSLQTVFRDRFDDETAAFDRLIEYLPHDVTRLKNDPADFTFEPDTVLKHYRGSDAYVEIPSFVEEIAKEAFRGCRDLVTVMIPPSVKKIGRRAFFGCSKLTEVLGMGDVEEVDASAFSNTPADPSESTKYCLNGVIFGGTAKDGRLELPPARVIAGYALYDCEAKTVVLPEGLLSIGEGAFFECDRLTSITFPATLTHLGKNAFLNCRELKSATFKAPMPEDAPAAFGPHTTLTEEK